LWNSAFSKNGEERCQFPQFRGSNLLEREIYDVHTKFQIKYEIFQKDARICGGHYILSRCGLNGERTARYAAGQ
jgi:hypothetical protein